MLHSYLSAWSGDPTAAKASDIFRSATKTGADILGIETGELREGAIADICLVDLSLPELTPCHNLTSNLVYAANGSCVDTTIVDGKVLMRGRIVPNEAAIRSEAIRVGEDLFKRSKQKNR